MAATKGIVKVSAGQTATFKQKSTLSACYVMHHWLECYQICMSISLGQRGERGGSVVECRTPEREVGGSKPTAAVLCPWARHFTPRKYWLITQEAVAPSRYDWKIVDWDVKPQHNQPTNQLGQSQWLIRCWWPWPNIEGQQWDLKHRELCYKSALY